MQADSRGAVKIYASETKLIAMAKAKGGRCDDETRLWRMHENDARGLGKRIARAEEQEWELVPIGGNLFLLPCTAYGCLKHVWQHRNLKPPASSSSTTLC